MRFRLTLICLQKVAVFLLIFIDFFCMYHVKTEKEAYTKIKEALENPLKVRVLDLSRQELALKEKEIIQKLLPNTGLIFEYH
ncbi:hypothetical protein LEP1GSC043_3181 [Leptospira weilii str. Ecochallenge]|uniref:Uncharacterized protein n=1 Tax=Leptospira weilii str. Ecochallenge TaxID=1049986 RepID=N1TY08_9LEPT|nr:hypothetical protein LEP1GSC043_3181 [Leptospira weilii str. Ecochallenge]